MSLENYRTSPDTLRHLTEEEKGYEIDHLRKLKALERKRSALALSIVSERLRNYKIVTNEDVKELISHIRLPENISKIEERSILKRCREVIVSCGYYINDRERLSEDQIILRYLPFKPIGQVKVIYDLPLPGFIFYDQTDYEKAVVDPISYSSKGVASTPSDSNMLHNMIYINATVSGVESYKVQNVIDHEYQHVINSQFDVSNEYFADINSKINKGIDVVSQASNSKDYKGAVNNLAHIMASFAYTLTKDEVLARLRGNQDIFQTLNALEISWMSDKGPYNFHGQFAQRLQKILNKIDTKVPIEASELDELQSYAFDEILLFKYESNVKKALIAIGMILSRYPSQRIRIIHELLFIPLTNWHRYAIDLIGRNL